MHLLFIQETFQDKKSLEIIRKKIHQNTTLQKCNAACLHPLLLILQVVTSENERKDTTMMMVEDSLMANDIKLSLCRPMCFSG